MEENKRSNGVGIRNIKARLSIFQGKAHVTTSPGKGYSLEVEMPIEHASLDGELLRKTGTN